MLLFCFARSFYSLAHDDLNPGLELLAVLAVSLPGSGIPVGATMTGLIINLRNMFIAYLVEEKFSSSL